MSTAGIILIGDEILSGKVRDENAHFLVGELRALGVGLRKIATIPDVLDEIAATVSEFAARFDHVFTSGGVGPTHDDLTMEGVARAFGATVMRHPELEGLLRAYWGERLQERNLRMADVPQGAHFVHGEPSAGWPVIAMRNVYILPGVPDLFRKKFTSIRERFRDQPFVLKQLFTTSEEGHIAHELDRIVAAYATVQVGSYPTFTQPEYKVQVTIEGKDAAAVQKACDDLVRALGSAVVRVE
ncbi:MAG TPA: competence/damage-inducible protein A [Polyangia bacterium]|jgi:molybdenum cofactor synthesis domain-containing protein